MSASVLDNTELIKFIDELGEHLKKIEIPDSHIQMLCKCLGEVRLQVKLPLDSSKFNLATPGWYVDGGYEFELKEIVSVEKLAEEIRSIVQGNRADVIYAFQDFATNFLTEKESEEAEA